MEILTLIVIGLFGSGGIVAFYTIWASNKTRRREIELDIKKVEMAKIESDKQLLQVIRKEIPLEHHSIFATIDEIEYFFLRSFNLSDQGRTIIIKEICINMLRVWRDVIKRYAIDAQICFDKCDFKQCNKTENDFIRMLLEGTERYTSVWDMANKMDVFGKVYYDSESLETMRIFIPIFKDWHMSREEIIRIASHDIPRAEMNRNCHGDWWDMLMVYQYSFVQMKYDALHAMQALNGEMTGKKFLGITVGDLHKTI